MRRFRCFPRHSWVDLPHVVYNHSTYQAFHFHHSLNSFCLPLTLSILPLAISQILGTFHPTPWPLAWPHCPISSPFTLDSDPLYPAPSKQVSLPSSVLSFLLSFVFPSAVLASTLKTSLPGHIHPYSNNSSLSSSWTSSLTPHDSIASLFVENG